MITGCFVVVAPCGDQTTTSRPPRTTVRSCAGATDSGASTPTSAATIRRGVTSSTNFCNAVPRRREACEYLGIMAGHDQSWVRRQRDHALLRAQIRLGVEGLRDRDML